MGLVLRLGGWSYPEELLTDGACDADDGNFGSIRILGGIHGLEGPGGARGLHGAGHAQLGASHAAAGQAAAIQGLHSVTKELMLRIPGKNPTGAIPIQATDFKYEVNLTRQGDGRRYALFSLQTPAAAMVKAFCSCPSVAHPIPLSASQSTVS
jgi:hypothetical protein